MSKHTPMRRHHRLLGRVVAWTRRREERRGIAGAHHRSDLDALGGIAARMTVDYRVAVARGADRGLLAGILTGIAGCYLAASRCCAAMGWDPDPRPGKPSHAESTRLAGLLAHEVAYAAAEGTDYCGMRAFELRTEPIAQAIRHVALAYAGWAPNPHGTLGVPGGPVTVEQRLDELLGAVLDVTRGPAVELLASLAVAHGRGRALGLAPAGGAS
ncbi:MAG: hypothetical protein ACRDT0_01520 [Pseudonocardiaceae bacterium]